MEISVREAKARFSEIAEAAARGETVVVTRHGEPFVEMVPVRHRNGFSFELLEQVRRDMGWENVRGDLPDNFDDPGYSRKVLGLDE